MSLRGVEDSLISMSEKQAYDFGYIEKFKRR
jgi:hypothetical protein